ncbi:MAG: hypothetical protein ACTHLH_11310, partial [Solirubrobacterales bacterium]
MVLRRGLAIAALFALLLIAGCGSGEDRKAEAGAAKTGNSQPTRENSRSSSATKEGKKKPERASKPAGQGHRKRVEHRQAR